MVSKNILSCTNVFNIEIKMNVSSYPKIISEGPCDIEDWSNDAKKSALITGINYI